MTLKKTYEKMARPLGVKGHQKQSYLSACTKADGAAAVESSNERTTLLAMDVDPRVKAISTQPFTVRLDLQREFSSRSEALKAKPRAPLQPVNGSELKERVYTPDFVVSLVGDPVKVAVESKDTDEIAKIQTQLAVRGMVLKNIGYYYLVVSSAEIDHKGLHANLVMLRNAMFWQMKNDVRRELAEVAEAIDVQRSEFTLGDIRHRCDDLKLYLALVNGVLGCDLRSGHFNVNTALWPAHGDLSHLQLINLNF